VRAGKIWAGGTSKGRIEGLYNRAAPVEEAAGRADAVFTVRLSAE